MFVCDGLHGFLTACFLYISNVHVFYNWDIVLKGVLFGFIWWEGVGVCKGWGKWGL